MRRELFRGRRGTTRRESFHDYRDSTRRESFRDYRDSTRRESLRSRRHSTRLNYLFFRGRRCVVIFTGWQISQLSNVRRHSFNNASSTFVWHAQNDDTYDSYRQYRDEK